MNWLDITLICLVAIGFIKGLFDGLVKQVVSLLALCVGIFFCGRLALWLKAYLLKLDWFPVSSVTIISYVASFILIVAVIMLAGDIVSKVIGATPLGLFNHLLGGVVGAVMMVVFLSLIISAISMIDPNSRLISAETKSGSKFYTEIGHVVPTIYSDNLFTQK